MAHQLVKTGGFVGVAVVLFFIFYVNYPVLPGWISGLTLVGVVLCLSRALHSVHVWRYYEGPRTKIVVVDSAASSGRKRSGKRM